MSMFGIKPEDYNKTAYLVPPYPLFRYTWQDILNLNKVARGLLWITSTTFAAILLVGFYTSALVFVGEPVESLKFSGPYGFYSGILCVFFAFKIIHSLLRLTIYSVSKRS